LPQIALCLVDPQNDFQQLLRADAEAAAREAGLAVDVSWSGHELSGQLTGIGRRLTTEPKPDAILVMAVRDRGLGRLVREAGRAGIHWLFLNRSEDELPELRREFPQLAISCVCADELETGRIQGRILSRLLPAGGRVLYVEGTRRSLAARDRSAGAAEAVQGTKIELVPVEAGWTSQESEEAVHGWLAVALRAQRKIDLVACHTDAIALGAIAALRRMATELGRPELVKIPIVGCDGTPTLGQAMVADGRLVATIVLPRSAGPAVQVIASVLRGGSRPDAFVMLKGEPFFARP
jgi:ABC-type sugar transport system substrate-binding protein